MQVFFFLQIQALNRKWPDCFNKCGSFSALPGNPLCKWHNYTECKWEFLLTFGGRAMPTVFPPLTHFSHSSFHSEPSRLSDSLLSRMWNIWGLVYLKWQIQNSPWGLITRHVKPDRRHRRHVWLTNDNVLRIFLLLCFCCSFIWSYYAAWSIER